MKRFSFFRNLNFLCNNFENMSGRSRENEKDLRKMLSLLSEDVRRLTNRVQVQEDEIRRLKRRSEKEEDPFTEITETFDSHRNWLLDDMRREREKSRIENEKIRIDELKSEVVEQILQDQKNEIENLKIALST